MRCDLVKFGPALQIEADHFIGAQGGLASSPKMNQQASNDGAVSLNLNPDRIGAEQVAAAEDVLEEAEEQLDRPAVQVDVSNDFSGYVQQVGRDPDHSVAGRPCGAAPAFAGALVWLRFDQNDSHRMARSFS